MRRGKAGGDQELGSVRVVRQENSVGYDNPGFQSQILDWADNPQIVCQGSSTPARLRHKPLDTDSAFQESSIAVLPYCVLSTAGSKYDISRPLPAAVISTNVTSL